jgi:RNA polymerase sigma-70 factor (ECF subfamily)
MEQMAVDWAEIYSSTYTDLVQFLYRRVWDLERARDLAQETFLRALGHAPANPRSWIFTVALNLARDEARTAIRRKRHLTLLHGEAEADAAAEARAMPEPIQRIEQSAREETARRALDALSEGDRGILLLWQAGLSYREIAAETGLAVGSIGTTLARARRRLADAYHGLEAQYVAH